MASNVVYHFGPDVAFVGGMASVLSLYEEQAIGGEVIIKPTWVPGDLARTLRYTAASLKTVLGLERTDIVHVHLSEGGSFVREGAVLALAAARGLRTVVTMHGADFLSFSEKHRKLSAWVLGRADAVLCLSEDVAERVRDLVPSVRVVTMPNPVVVDEGSPPAHKTAEVVLFAGEVGVRKGADVLEQAWRKIAKARADARCIVVGPPTSLRVAPYERLTVRGPAPLAEVKELLREARVVVLPSRAEAMPMILIEAQGAARPFVATPIGAIPELAARGGLLVPVGDSERLADAVVELLANPDHAEDLGTRGQAYVRDTRSIAVVDARLRALYDEL